MFAASRVNANSNEYKVQNNKVEQNTNEVEGRNHTCIGFGCFGV